MTDGKKRKGLTVLALLATAVLVSIFVAVGPPQLLARSESPLFCAGCHVMESEYEAWSHAGAHRREMCVDCHLPNDNTLLHYTWKSIDGLKDVAVFYSGRVPERITISEHGRKVVQQNCLRCHETTVMHIDQERICWDCHRRISHRRSGAITTL
ncbi:MAG: cytochrome c nitrite reductase small subunit [Thermodesulfobacteriota bacterium]